MKRRRANSPFSLFSFQDIITGLCGIMIFFVMVMLVDFVGRRTECTRNRLSLVPTKDVEIGVVKKEISTLEEELSNLRQRSREVVLSDNQENSSEVKKRMIAEMDEKERRVSALVSQIADLRTRVENTKRADAEDRKRVKEMEETRRLLERRLSALKGRKGITLIPERGMFKIPVYLVCGKNGLEMLMPTDSDSVSKFCRSDEVRDFLDRELSVIDHTTYTVVLLVRPSGIALMDRIVEIVKGYGLEYGRDPLEEDVEVIVGKSGKRP